MTDYTGYLCPVCHKRMESKDDIVVCPECGTPCHRKCWEVRGGCANAGKHGTGFDWSDEKHVRYDADGKPAPEPSSRVESPADPFAGAFAGANGAGNASAAGAQQQADPQSKAGETLEGMPLEDWNTILGPNSFYFMMLFKQMEVSGRRTAFSFNAFLFGPFYFLYRKNWKPGLILAAVETLLSLPLLLYMLAVSGSALTAGMNADFLFRLGSACSILSYALMVVRALYAHFWYKQTMTQRLRNLTAQFPDPKQRQYVLNAKGGTSWGAVLGLLAFYLVMGWVISLFVGPNADALVSVLM